MIKKLLYSILLGFLAQSVAGEIKNSSSNISTITHEKSKPPIIINQSDSIPWPIYNDPNYHGSADPEVAPKNKNIFLQITELNYGNEKPFTNRSKRIALPSLPFPDGMLR